MKRLACVALAALSCGCADPEIFQTLRGTQLVTVTAQPPSARPGDTVQLELTYFDRESFEATGSAQHEVEVLWLGGCHDPARDSPLSCLPELGRLALGALDARDGAGIADVDARSLPKNTAFGRQYELRVPSQSVASRVRAPNSLGYGLSYVFYAVCRGRLTALARGPLQLPLACRDAQGHDVPKRHFTLGYTTVFVFDGLTSNNPPVSGVELDGELVTSSACSTDVDCPRSALSYRCFEGSCLPEVAACIGHCARHWLRPLVPDEAAELDPTSVRVGEPAARELLWVEYIGMGGVDRLESLIGDRSGQRREAYAAAWTPPARAFDRPVPFWTLVKDSRGGNTPARIDLLVR